MFMNVHAVKLTPATTEIAFPRWLERSMNAKTAKTVKNLVDLHHRDLVCDNELFTFVVEEAEKGVSV